MLVARHAQVKTLKFKKLKDLHKEKESGHHFDGPVLGFSSDHMQDEEETEDEPLSNTKLYKAPAYSSRLVNLKVSGNPTTK